MVAGTKNSSSTKNARVIYTKWHVRTSQSGKYRSITQEKVTKSTNKGCAQGSICRPTFGNIIIDSLLQRLTDAKRRDTRSPDTPLVHCQAFADDVVLAFSSESSSTIENAAMEAMKIVTKWGTENKLNFAQQKTQAVVLTKKVKFQNPTMQMAGSQINLVEEIKVLDLIIDTRLNFRSHVAAVCKKSIEIYKRLSCSAKVTWSLNSEIIRIIYTVEIEPIMMYASNTWAPATELEMIRSALNSLQRGFAIKSLQNGLTHLSYDPCRLTSTGPQNTGSRGAVQSKRLPRLKQKLEENEGTIYNNKSSQYIFGDARQNMAAYNDTCGLVYLDEQATKITEKAKYKILENNPIVEMTRDTKVALEERILRTMWKLSKENDQDYSETFTDWETPKITWINGVPECGKTTWIIQEFDKKRDCIVTTTIEAAEDLLRKLANSILLARAEATTRVRTMASILVNGFKEQTHNHLLIDEAMMNHFGAIITAAMLTKAKELLLIGDINQISHIDRHNAFPMSYEKSNAVAKVSRELLRSYRNPMDVAYALNEIYSGIYSTQEGTRSLTMDGYERKKLSISLPQTLYLAHTQAGKTELKTMEWGQGK
ncbi:hypothetical protein EVAR_102484_1 [Eumeta japonica]|uniref:(+)RNA virus helicase C-terminal domain-containing protein n=1 Tax=Eumeta variegata TaxID=151549 RepID=A0A4C1ZTP9_EUMVA|nr:hypothetical protein EVAR_102484_1 [Eumeta japonica]